MSGIHPSSGNLVDKELIALYDANKMKISCPKCLTSPDRIFQKPAIGRDGFVKTTQRWKCKLNPDCNKTFANAFLKSHLLTLGLVTKDPNASSVTGFPSSILRSDSPVQTQNSGLDIPLIDNDILTQGPSSVTDAAPTHQPNNTHPTSSPTELINNASQPPNPTSAALAVSPPLATQCQVNNQDDISMTDLDNADISKTIPNPKTSIVSAAQSTFTFDFPNRSSAAPQVTNSHKVSDNATLPLTASKPPIIDLSGSWAASAGSKRCKRSRTEPEEIYDNEIITMKNRIDTLQKTVNQLTVAVTTSNICCQSTGSP